MQCIPVGSKLQAFDCRQHALLLLQHRGSIAASRKRMHEHPLGDGATAAVCVPCHVCRATCLVNVVGAVHCVAQR